jgi:hypothetical protein
MKMASSLPINLFDDNYHKKKRNINLDKVNWLSSDDHYLSSRCLSFLMTLISEHEITQPPPCSQSIVSERQSGEYISLLLFWGKAYEVIKYCKQCNAQVLNLARLPSPWQEKEMRSALKLAASGIIVRGAEDRGQRTLHTMDMQGVLTSREVLKTHHLGGAAESPRLAW